MGQNVNCLRCGKFGHRAVECRLSGVKDFSRERTVVGRGSNNVPSERNTGKMHAEASAVKCVYTDEGEKIDVVVTTLQNPDELFLVPGMPVVCGVINNQKGTVLRDSGCNTVIVRQDFTQPEHLTGKNKAIYFLDHGVKLLPEVEVIIDTPYFRGRVKALAMENPLYDLTLGNIQGVRGVENPNRSWKARLDDKSENTQLTVLQKEDSLNLKCNREQKPCEVDRQGSTKPLEQQSPQSEKKSAPNSAKGRNSQHEDLEVSVVTRSQAAGEKVERTTKRLKVAKLNIVDVSPSELIQEQQADKTLQKCFVKVDQPWAQGKHNTEYVFLIKDKVLYRQKSTRIGQEVLQLVVPLKYRSSIMHLAHDTIMSAHLGNKKTCDRIQSEFYWPGLTDDVSRYVRSCDICQRTIPRGLISKVPLGKMPLIDTPFKRVAVDLIGPLQPRSERGHCYVLTLTDYATRYPEAVALKRIDSEAVADALIEIFSRVGVPEEILHDQGSQFMSGIMKEVCRTLSMRQLSTTAYHPMCNGLVEKFNGTLKKMIKRLSAERPTDWDRYLAPALFAYREVPQESMGFSPFELLYGRHVRGPLSILKELWTGKPIDDETKTLYQYVIELRDRLEHTCQLAHEELEKSAGRYRKYYDSKAKDRKMKIGDQVLLLLPTDNNKLVMQWKGPYPVVGQLNGMDYKIQIGSQVKTFHANLLKKYEVRRDNQDKFSKAGDMAQLNAVLMREEQTNSNEESYLIPSVLGPTETIEDVFVDSSLSTQQQEELRALIAEYPDIFVNVPGHTTLEECQLKMRTDKPLFTRQYPMPYAVKDEVEKEVEMMLQMGIIEKSESPIIHQCF